MTAPHLRPATTADIESLCALGARTFRATYAEMSDPAEVDDYARTHFTPAKVSAWLAAPGACTVIASTGQGDAGYAHLRHAPVPACVADRTAMELSRLYLLPSAQGRGLGAALLHRMLDEAAARSAHSIWLGAYDRNLKALAFYEARGFRRVGTHDFEFGGRVYADPVLVRPVAPLPA
ncbi:MAG TPA: GNAT family N-acetyltransferase [Burkholderiaceae bacterium]